MYQIEHLWGKSNAALLVALLLGGMLAVFYRSVRPPEGYDQNRLHFNSTRFDGATTDDVTVCVSCAVRPATALAVAILYDLADWQGGLAAASLLRPLDAVLLPATPGIAEELAR